VRNGGPLGTELPGEVERASFRERLLVLTDRRIVHKGRGRTHHESRMMRLGDVTSVGIVRKRAFRPEWLFLPLGIFLFGLFMALEVDHEGPFVLGILMAFITLPVAWLGGGGLWLQVATSGDLLRVRIRRSHLAEANAFLHEVERARDQATRNEPDQELGPTTVPFGR
jgi:hypothetical protein